MIEGLAVPGLEFIAEPAVGVLQDFIAGAAEAKVAVPGVVELVAIAHDGDRLTGGTRGFRKVGRDAVRPCGFEYTAAGILEVTEFGGMLNLNGV